jgi:hypothetical protein
MAKSTRDKLLREGLIVELEPDRSQAFGPFQIIIQRFEMPISIHMQWCDAMSAECDAQKSAITAQCNWCDGSGILELGDSRAADCPACCASGMSASGQDPKGLEAKPASPTREAGDAQ